MTTPTTHPPTPEQAPPKQAPPKQAPPGQTPPPPDTAANIAGPAADVNAAADIAAVVDMPHVDYPWIAICPTCDQYTDAIHPVTPDGEPYDDPDDVVESRDVPTLAPPRWFHIDPCSHVVPNLTAYRWADPTPTLQPEPEPVAAAQTPAHGATESTDSGEQAPADVRTPTDPSPAVLEAVLESAAAPEAGVA